MMIETASTDVFDRFLRSRCMVDPRGSVWFTDLYGAFSEWCDENAEALALSRKSVGAYLRSYSGIVVRRSTASRLRVFGITLSSVPSHRTGPLPLGEARHRPLAKERGS